MKNWKVTPARQRQHRLRQTKGSLSMALANIRIASKSEYLSSSYKMDLITVAHWLSIILEHFNKNVGWKEKK